MKKEIDGWARLYEEPSQKEGGLFSFTHTIFVYASKMEAEGRERDQCSNCLGIFPVRFVVCEGVITFLTPAGSGESPGQVSQQPVE